METRGVKYIGSKKKLIAHILEHAKDIPIGRFLDVFTGTTRVAQAFRKKGWQVVSSDLAWASECYAELFLKSTESDIPLLEKYVEILNSLEGEADWITKNYCDIVTSTGGLVRVWKPKNGMKADAIRNRIDLWEKTREIDHHIAMSLVAIIILALDAVDSTVGVQQAYLKSWSARSDNNLLLKVPEDIITGHPGSHIVGNCLTIEYEPADLAYVDPPYSPHSYATYYHIWDSIARWDKPQVGLNTNRRLDRISKTFDDSMKSDWNRASTAITAFETLFDRLHVKYILLSYSNESLISLEKLKDIMKKYKSYTINEVNYTRNIMSQIGNAADIEEPSTSNIEYIILIEKW
jgi:adenine-specific DNA-methyltransferase